MVLIVVGGRGILLGRSLVHQHHRQTLDCSLIAALLRRHLVCFPVGAKCKDAQNRPRP